MSERVPLWERERGWPLMRPFVYYLVENFVPSSWVSGARVVDFSAGLGDLTTYLAGHDPAAVIATVPERHGPRPDLPAGVALRTGVLASRIAAALDAESVDLFCARMVFQFPRWEDEEVDVDVMLEQIRRVLAPGGRVVVATHAFFPLQNYSSLQDEADSGALLDRLVRLAAGAPHDVHEILTEEAQRLSGLTEMVRYLGLPPRESSMGVTGYGLRVPALVNSFIRAGLQLEVVDDIEPFTYPLGVWEQFDSNPEGIAELGHAVFQIKRRWLTDERYDDPYARPALIKRMLQEIRWLVPIVRVPIVRVAARRVEPG
jgi:SAM-dependent methyltransferase